MAGARDRLSRLGLGVVVKTGFHEICIALVVFHRIYVVVVAILPDVFFGLKLKLKYELSKAGGERDLTLESSPAPTDHYTSL